MYILNIMKGPHLELGGFAYLLSHEGRVKRKAYCRKIKGPDMYEKPI